MSFTAPSPPGIRWPTALVPPNGRRSMAHAPPPPLPRGLRGTRHGPRASHRPPTEVACGRRRGAGGVRIRSGRRTPPPPTTEPPPPLKACGCAGACPPPPPHTPGGSRAPRCRIGPRGFARGRRLPLGDRPRRPIARGPPPEQGPRVPKAVPLLPQSHGPDPPAPPVHCCHSPGAADPPPPPRQRGGGAGPPPPPQHNTTHTPEARGGGDEGSCECPGPERCEHPRSLSHRRMGL